MAEKKRHDTVDAKEREKERERKKESMWELMKQYGIVLKGGFKFKM